MLEKKSKKSGYGRNSEAARYNTRNKGKKHFQHGEKEDTDDSELSDWYTDSDYELEHDVFDDAEFDENVNGDPDVVPEFEEMGHESYCSDDVCNSNVLESLAGSETEEDEEGNPIKMPTRLVDYPIAHPLFNKLPGKLKKKRIPSQGENGNPTPPAPTEGKLPKTGVTMTCKLCGQQSHNRIGCPITKAKKAAEAQKMVVELCWKCLVYVPHVQRAPAPPKESRPIKDQVKRSKKGWKKMKLAIEGSSAGNVSGSASTQPPTQSSQNHAAKGATK
ncbi:hypothetical protein ACLB2K_019790 [Fragaria x ananassa]